MKLPIHIKGQVVEGTGRGKKQLVATANIEIHQPKDYFPPFGVYAAALKFDRKWYEGVASVGVAETFNDIRKPKVEIHIFDFNETLYGEMVEVRLMEYIRDMKKFDSVGDLKKQINEDIEMAKMYFESVKKI